MKPILFYCAGLLIILTQISACSKKSSSSNTSNSCKLTGINAVGSNSFETVTISYGSDGKVSTIVQSSPNFNQTSTYVRKGNVVIMTTTGYSNGDIVVDSVVLNSDGMMVSDQERNMFDTSLTTYIYTGTEVVSSIYQQAGQSSSADTYTFSDGDFIKDDYTDATTYNDKASAPGDYLQVEQLVLYAAPYLKTAHQITSSTSNNVTTNYAYSYDSTGKITQLVITGQTNETWNYSYDCK